LAFSQKRQESFVQEHFEVCIEKPLGAIAEAGDPGLYAACASEEEAIRLAKESSAKDMFAGRFITIKFFQQEELNGRSWHAVGFVNPDGNRANWGSNWNSSLSYFKRCPTCSNVGEASLVQDDTGHYLECNWCNAEIPAIGEFGEE
jgi:hypothetical protein